MTRTPRANDLRTRTAGLRKRLPADVSRKTLISVGAGLALAGAGAVAVTTGLSGTTASASADSVGHAAVVAASQRHAGAADHGKAGQAGHDKAGKAAQTDKQAAKGATAKHSAKHPAKHPVKHTAKHPAKHARTWAAVSKIVAQRTYPKPGHGGGLPAQDQLTPVGTTGPQTYMPITADRYANAKTIVKQAIDKHMGLRSAVIAVATAMQESTLQNIKYGTSDSLGLFQQRPSMGWGTAQQVTTPSYAADSFLNALHKYQASNPGWAHQPLWQQAQGVQASAFPTAYAKWEAQAAQLVQSVTTHLV